MDSLDRVEEVNKPHAVCVPLPAQGHISPMLNLAKLLHSKGFHITFVNTEFNRRRLLSSRGRNSFEALPASFRFEAIPDGLPPSNPDATQDPALLVQAMLNNCHDPFKKLLLRLNDPSSGSPPVTCILSDCTMPFTLDVAYELGSLPVLLLWTASACGFLAYAQYRFLLDKGIVPFKGTRGGPHTCPISGTSMGGRGIPRIDPGRSPRKGSQLPLELHFNDPDYLSNGCLDMVVDWVPSMKGISLKDIPSFIRTMDKDDILFNFMMIIVEKSSKSMAPIIFNTFDALEHDILKDVSKMVGPIYTIGPLHFHLEQILTHHEDYNNNDDDEIEVTSLRSNLWKEDLQCLGWLDLMKPNSVVYVSFGSITTMTKDNLIEFAWGLANSNHPFLWIVRPDIVTGDSAVLPQEFIEKTKDRSMIADWCDQEKVLKHRAIGAFLTHCGWNSSLDAICGGKPVLCWPYFAEQQTNCWYFCNRLSMGMEIKKDVKSAEIEKQVREVMKGERSKEMRRNALKWKRLAEEATSSTGSSYMNFVQLINQVCLLLKPSNN